MPLGVIAGLICIIQPPRGIIVCSALMFMGTNVLIHEPAFHFNQVMVSAKEESDLDIPPTMDGLLRIHKRIVDVDLDPANTQPGNSKTVSTRLLVATTQARSLIGKKGATIKSIQDASNCTIRVLSGGKLSKA